MATFYLVGKGLCSDFSSKPSNIPRSTEVQRLNLSIPMNSSIVSLHMVSQSWVHMLPEPSHLTGEVGTLRLFQLVPAASLAQIPMFYKTMQCQKSVPKEIPTSQIRIKQQWTGQAGTSPKCWLFWCPYSCAIQHTMLETFLYSRRNLYCIAIAQSEDFQGSYPLNGRKSSFFKRLGRPMQQMVHAA